MLDILAVDHAPHAPALEPLDVARLNGADYFLVAHSVVEHKQKTPDTPVYVFKVIHS